MVKCTVAAIFGSVNAMRFSVKWIDGGSNGAAEERATLCDLRIYVSDQNACRFVDFVSNEDTEALIVPAVHLAEVSRPTGGSCSVVATGNIAYSAIEPGSPSLI